MTISWRAQLNTGNTRIDNDHKRLFELINAVELTVTGKRGSEALTAALDALHEYTEYHFKREERIMAALEYEGIEAHESAHASLKLQLDEIRQRIAVDIAGNKPVSADEIADLTKLLRSWLVDHIVGMDLPLKPLLGPPGPGYTGES